MRIKHANQRRGAAVVEMAIVGPLCLFTIIGILDIGLAVWSHNNLSHATREGARYAQVHGAQYAVSSPGASGPTANDPNVEKVVRANSFVHQNNLTVSSSWPDGTNNSNSPVNVQATYTYSPILSFGLGRLTLQSTVTMYINY